MGVIRILILLNFTIFPTCDESLKKIGEMVPEIFDVSLSMQSIFNLENENQVVRQLSALFQGRRTLFIEFEYAAHGP